MLSTVQNAAEGEQLDLTNSHLPSLEEVQLPSTLTSLDLTANRLKALEPHLLALTGLWQLSLRQNLLTSAATAELGRLRSAGRLQELILHDNQLTQIPSLRDFTALQRLEVSYNEIRSLAPLAELCAPHLAELFAASNKIAKIEAVSQFTALRQLELGSNRIRELGGLEQLGHLQELWLGMNRITAIANLSSLTALQKLSLQSNRLASMAGLGACTALQELYLSHNGISEIEEFESLTNLKVLDVSNNRIEEVPRLQALTNLTDLWLNDNQIQDLRAVLSALEPIHSTVSVLYLNNNPAMGVADYKQLLMEALPKLQQLDDAYVRGGP